jgi:aspartate dehydrogenase
MKIGLIGFGSIGYFIAKNIGKEIAWVLDMDPKAAERMAIVGLKCPFYGKLPANCGGADLIIEAASQKAVPLLLDCLPCCDVMVMSVGAFADEALLEKMKAAAKKHGRKIYLPSGAVGGMDVISSVSGQITSLVLETTKPPVSLGRNDSARTVVFEGSAREACKLYPKNVNVSATLSLAGIGFDKTIVRIVSDPDATANTHKITVKSPAGGMKFEFENVPSQDNPKTSALAALSALRRLSKTGETLQIG